MYPQTSSCWVAGLLVFAFVRCPRSLLAELAYKTQSSFSILNCNHCSDIDIGSEIEHHVGTETGEWSYHAILIQPTRPCSGRRGFSSLRSSRPSMGRTARRLTSQPTAAARTVPPSPSAIQYLGSISSAQDRLPLATTQLQA